MAEVKNSFLSSKMNKDLDDRLIPNSEYRDALNIEVGKSETNNIGVLQNVYGNVEIPIENIPNLECIGMFMDNQNNRIYQFLTNYRDQNPNQITLCETLPYSPSPNGWIMKITVYDLNTLTSSTLVEGTFLNFSKSNLILGVNLVEGLLFWTDNRNQPRKINYNKAINDPSYYTTEVQISVAKYAPIEPISLIRRAVTNVTTVIDSSTFELESAVGIVEGMTIVADGLSSCDYTYVTNVTDNTITTYSPTPGITEGMQLTFLISTMTNKSDDTSWPGDPAFLEDKYVRFSYRFKFDDNEYSLMAPFTQIAYIPRQKGYFINGDEASAYSSTIIKWMENNVNNIELLIPLPDTGANINSTYKIVSIDVLYKESDSLAVKVLETVPWTTISNSIPNINVYNYPYQSQKPYKTLNENQTTRVYDIVPTRALSQEIAGNRVIYGNFYNTYTPPANINYYTAVQPKSDTFTNFIEYPNHTLKQNRNYQVGFILADKFGRQSSVLLSTVDLTNIQEGSVKYGGSTVYAPYKTESDSSEVKCWFGDALLVLVNDPITSLRNIPGGTPGLYAEQTSPNGFSITDGEIVGNTYKFVLEPTATNTIPFAGQSMRGAFTDYVRIDNVTTGPSPWDYTITTTAQVNDLYLPVPAIPGVFDTKFVYTINQIGWYSYKVVVKQQQQDYYNAYLPGMLDGYPSGQTFGSQVTYTGIGTASTPTLQNGINTTNFPTGETGRTSHIVLINDNINKIPRDLSEVGPDQKQYRSSVQLFGRVENTALTYELESELPFNNKYATTITYDLALNPLIFDNVKPGDGIQSVEANAPYPNPDPSPPGPPTIASPYAWYGDTVVVSNIIDPLDPTKGIITFSPPNWTRESGGTPGPGFINYIITKAENVQYFPTRKADVVSSIATATDFNFLENTVDNVRGSAGLNFYQLQTRPLIGRVSTTKTIGVPSDLMVPFLSVYETAPETSALALFWETASTGYISDLNYDVLNGYDGPASISDTEFIFFENQEWDVPPNPEAPTGAPNSPYITGEFEILNNTGFPLTLFSVPTLFEVENILGDVVTDKFDIEETSPGFYRLKIKDYFVFDFGASLGNSTFIFTINVEWQPGVFNNITYQGRLGNIPPSFNEVFPDYNTVIDQTVGPVVTMTAKNGTSNPVVTGSPIPDQINLYWDILSGNDDGYFLIDHTSGLITLINASIPLGTYVLEVIVYDAYNAVPPTPVTGALPYRTLSDDILVNITVGPKPVNDYLQYYNTNDFIWQYYSLGGQIACAGVPGQGFGAVYIGRGDYELDPVTHINTNLPNLTQTSPAPSTSAYQNYVNVQIANGADPNIDPPSMFGLTKGSLEWTIKTKGISKDDESRESDVKFILYYRPSFEAPNNIWAPILDDNNVGPALVVPTDWTNGFENSGILDYKLGIKTVSAGTPSGTYAERSTSFVTSTPGEYCLVIWHKYTTFRDLEWTPSCAVDFATSVEVKDANYTYVGLPPVPSPPPYPDYVNPPAITTAYEYNVQLKDYFNDPNGVPYTIQNAANGFYFTTNNTLASSATIGTNILNLTTADPQLVDGLFVTLPGVLTTLQITNVSGTNIILSNNLDATVASGATATFSYPIDGARGSVWATTDNGLHVQQFYKDSALTEVWLPPLADKFYLFQNTDRDYSTGDYYGSTPPVTNKPLFSAKFDSLGRVITLDPPNNTNQTAWAEEPLPTPDPLINFGRNLSQFVELA
jgi:hypothetical protein